MDPLNVSIRRQTSELWTVTVKVNGEEQVITCHSCVLIIEFDLLYITRVEARARLSNTGLTRDDINTLYIHREKYWSY